jgi:flagellin-specific chaperone FliS
LKDSSEFLSIIGVMESLLNQDDFSKFRSDIFKIINLIERLKSSLGGDKRE